MRPAHPAGEWENQRTAVRNGHDGKRSRYDARDEGMGRRRHAKQPSRCGSLQVRRRCRCKRDQGKWLLGIVAIVLKCLWTALIFGLSLQTSPLVPADARRGRVTYGGGRLTGHIDEGRPNYLVLGSDCAFVPRSDADHHAARGRSWRRVFRRRAALGTTRDI